MVHAKQEPRGKRYAVEQPADGDCTVDQAKHKSRRNVSGSVVWCRTAG